MTQRSTPHASLAVRLGHMSKWFTDQSYEAITLREARDALAATPALGPCTQAELDAAAFDSKQSRLIAMWMERALKAEAATPAVGWEADEQLWGRFVNHYWDSLEGNKEIVLKHVRAVLDYHAENSTGQPASPLRGRDEAIEECAKLIESGAGMADLIDQEELDQQAKYIRALAAQPASPLRGTVERAIDAVSDVISGRDDMGHVHFVELATAIRAACAAPMDGETKA